jgi:acid phosphatase (class A)
MTMMRLTWPVAVAATVLALASPSLAAKPDKTLMMLTPEEAEFARLLPPPPADGSPRGVAELAEVKAVIAADTPDRYTQAKWDDDHEDPSAFYAVVGGGFDLAKLSATKEAIAIAENDAMLTARQAKSFFNRKRPWAVDASIKTCDPDDKPLTAYPSGHATMGYTVSLVLAELMPAKAQAILDRAEDYAFSRMLCGSHFASDTEASHVLSTAVFTKLMAKPGYQAKLAAARTELKAAGLIP